MADPGAALAFVVSKLERRSAGRSPAERAALGDFVYLEDIRREAEVDRSGICAAGTGRMEWRGLGVDAYHAWLFLPRQSGTHVITEETQYGALARMQKLFMPGRMRRGHQMWLEKLSENAQSGMPP